MGKEKQRVKIDEDDVVEEEEEDTVSKLVKEGNDGGDIADGVEANEDLSSKIVEEAPLTLAAMTDQNENYAVVVISDDDDVSKDVPGVVSVSGGGNIQVIELASSPSIEAEAVLAKKKKKRKTKKMKIEDKSSIVVKEEENQEIIKALEAVKASEELPESVDPNGVEISNNIVLWKLLRGPRYFDPPDSGWSTCYNCGEEGHMAVNCPSRQKKRKPCFVCGSLEHGAKECKKGRACFICRKGGHQAKDCPERNKENINGSRKCLKCGDSGHDMFSCSNSYPLDDLKVIECYVCKVIGHLCCADFVDDDGREVSCYKCGEVGHHAMACSWLHEKANNVATPSSYRKCGGVHSARECRSSVKVGKRKRKREQSTTKKTKNKLERKSAPHDLGMDHKKKITNSEERGITTAQKSKHRGGWTMEHLGDSSKSKSKSEEQGITIARKSKNRGSWTMEHPGDSLKSKSKSKERDLRTPQKSKNRGGWIAEHLGDYPEARVRRSPWTSPSTPFYNNHEVSTPTAADILPNARSSTVMQNSRLGTPLFPGSPVPFQQRYSASRFGSSGGWHGNSRSWYGDSSSAGMRRGNSGGWHGPSSSWYGNSSSAGTRRGYDWR